MNSILRASLIRKPAAPHAYRAEGAEKRTSTDCPHCNPTARAMRIVLARWVVAGIDKGEE